MKFLIENIGCKVNSYDAQSVATLLENAGYERVFEDEAVDVAIVFTCAVTNIAAQKSRKLIRQIKKKNEDAILVVAGCYSQIESEVLKDIDIVVGSIHKTKILDYIEQFKKDHKPIRDIQKLENLSFEEATIDHFETQTRAYLKIQDGCNQFCSYCIIPYARGRERSMDPDHVLEEAKQIFKNHKEIVLTGIHTGRYGSEYHLTLADMIEKILDQSSDDIRLRISSIEMTEVDDKLISLMKKDNRIAKHFHIPLQAGSNEILKAMNRPYTCEEYYEKIQKIREEIPDISISTDLIVGFPGETDELFEKTVEFLKKCKFSFLHVFPFSLRSGTVAEKLEHPISPVVKKERVRRCLAISEELYKEYKTSWLNRTVDVLVEKTSENDSFGHSSNYLPVKINKKTNQGEFVEVVLKELDGEVLQGEVI